MAGTRKSLFAGHRKGTIASDPRSESDTSNIRVLAQNLSQNLIVFRAATPDEIDAAFAAMARDRADAVMVNGDSFFARHLSQFAVLAARYRIPAIYNNRAYVLAGGLMSYGDDRTDTVRQAGIYVGRILSGEKPADLPVVQPSKFQFVMNLRTAKALGLPMPFTLRALATQVIE